ncbi:hypothetical protein Tco_0206944 [Tanacetum coccineum]
MIKEPGNPDRTPLVLPSSHLQTDDELTAEEAKQVEVDDQAIQTILIGLPKDIYAIMDNCNSAKEIWLRVQQMMKGTYIGVQEKEAKLLNELERFTSVDEESNESYYHRFNVGNHNGLIVVPAVRNQNGNVVAARDENNARPKRRDASYLQTQLLIAQKEEARIQLQAEEFDLIVTLDCEEIEEVNANCILMANLQQASTSGTHADKEPIYDSHRSAKGYQYENCYDNEIFNMFAQEEQYIELLEPTTNTYLMQHDDSNVILMDSSMDPSRGDSDKNSATIE